MSMTTTNGALRIAAVLLVAAAAGACEKKKKDPGAGGGSGMLGGDTKDPPKPPGASASPSASASPVNTAPPEPANPMAGWSDYSGDGDSFSIKFPEKPTETVQKIDTAMGPMNATMAMHIEEATKRAYFAMGGKYNLPKGIPFDVDKGLSGGRDGMVGAIGGSVIKEDKIEIDGRPAREFTLKGSKPGIGDFTGVARIAYDAKETRVYQAIVISTEPTTFPEVRQFLDSMHIK